MKKIFKFALITLLSLGIYGCSSDEDSNDDTKKEVVEQKEEQPKTDKEILDLGVTEEQLKVIKENIKDYDDINNVQIWKNSKESIDGNGVLDLWAIQQNYRVIIQDNDVTNIASYIQGDNKEYTTIYEKQ